MTKGIWSVDFDLRDMDLDGGFTRNLRDMDLDGNSKIWMDALTFLPNES